MNKKYVIKTVLIMSLFFLLASLPSQSKAQRRPTGSSTSLSECYVHGKVTTETGEPIVEGKVNIEVPVFRSSRPREYPRCQSAGRYVNILNGEYRDLLRLGSNGNCPNKRISIAKLYVKGYSSSKEYVDRAVCRDGVTIEVPDIVVTKNPETNTGQSNSNKSIRNRRSMPAPGTRNRNFR